MCAVVAFVAAFFAAGAAQTTTKHVRAHTKAVAFADSAAGAVATSFSGQPAALKLPPPRHVKHHSTPAPVATVTVAPTTSTPATAPAAAAPVVPAPAKHKKSGGSGTGVTIVGP